MKKRKQKKPVFEIAIAKEAPGRSRNEEGYGKVKVTFRKRRHINIPTLLGI